MKIKFGKKKVRIILTHEEAAAVGEWPMPAFGAMQRLWMLLPTDLPEYRVSAGSQVERDILR